jgi:hypothetical protein
MEMSIDTLNTAGDFLDCRIADKATIDLMYACETKFHPDGAICDVLENGSCSFYKELKQLTCDDYCQEQDSTCLFGGGFGNNCEGRIEDRRLCSEKLVGDFCTCAW